MLNKFYPGVLALFVVITGFFIFYSWSWLQSIGLPANAVEGYNYHTNIASMVLCFSFVLLLLLANAILWKTGKAAMLWTTFIYFAVFVLLRYFWLDNLFLGFKKANGLWDGSFSGGPIFGVSLAILAGGLVFVDQFAVIRLRAKMYPKDVEPDEPTPTSIEE